ncbi:acyl-CoA thioesterase [Streptomyces sp. BR123]|uniref:acyl-CoA thioesterase n=1 Tax=Streptomyces sp. BR123 TaxID=2749828 RepID=UPI0015C43E50|nr:acyl-CoA thioesterase [Streptomyces sp. BR123]NXY94764.1 acyl-CoA thioesterase [Streptomyces sp. BR123]
MPPHDPAAPSPSSSPFTVRVTVREYELDTRGHLNQAVYLQYCEHALWEVLRAAGIPGDKLLAGGVGPAQLECTLRFRRELQGGDEVDVSCVFEWGEGKTFRLRQDIRRADGTLACEVTGVIGLLDLARRSLVPDPGAHLRELAEHPEVLGL